MEVIKKSFEDWTPTEIRDTFGLVENPQTPCLQEWLQASAEILPLELQQLAFLQERLSIYSEKWNEEDLKAYFIIPIVNMVDFLEPHKYRAFYEATIEAQIPDIQGQNVKLRGRPEFLVATGEEEPKRPFFFLHEYKPQLRTQKNPQGQVLIAMVAAQTKNTSKNDPLYGLYVMGQNWRFVTLQEKEYGISKQFDATDTQDLHTIFKMLKFVKIYIQYTIP